MSSDFKRLVGLSAAVMVILMGEPARAQTSLEGTWTAHFLTPGGEIASGTYELRSRGSYHEAAMEFGGGWLPLTGYEIRGNRLMFSMNPGLTMDCRLDRHEKRLYVGSCMDMDGWVGAAVVAPPGVSVTPDDLDLDEAFVVWGLSREAYERERYPSRNDAAEIAEPEPLPSQFVDLGGYHLNMVALGSGSVTVVLESGIGDDHQVWRKVQEDLAGKTRVISYDRAGLGRSERSDVPRTPDEVAQELREMLHAAGIHPPFVLVGHETGGFIVRQFRALYPDDVAGLVLVDPAHEGMDAGWSAADAESWRGYVSQKRAFLSAVSDVAKREFDAFVDVLKQGDLAHPDPSLDTPVVVLSGQRVPESPRWVGETAAGLKAKEALHRSLADVLNGDFIASTESGGNIHLEEPGLVVDAVERILDAIDE